MHTWERLAQLLQGVSTTGALRPMPDVIFAADRGYNSKQTIHFVSEVPGASFLGTQKRDLWYPYVFGDGPISRRHNGMVVSENGCRTVYTERYKNGGSRTPAAGGAEACVYRESFPGHVAALVRNNASLFPSRCFTIVFRDKYQEEAATRKLDSAMIVHDVPPTNEWDSRRHTRSQVQVVPPASGKSRVEQVLARVTPLTYLRPGVVPSACI